MKNLVNDIYDTLKSPPQVSDEWCDNFGKNIASIMKQRLQPRVESYKPRMSSLGRGDRYIWYSTRYTPKEELSGATLLKFLYGDVIEELLLALVKLSGHEVTHEQEELELHGIKGHIDCLIDGKLFDVKSASAFSFKKFKDRQLHEKGKDPFGYYAQLAAYSQAGNYEPYGWLVMDKQMGTLCVSESISFAMPDMSARALEVNAIVEKNKEPSHCHEPVEDGKSGNMKLAVQCSYCQFKEHCYRDSNNGTGLRTFLYSNGPRFLTTVAKEPNVLETSGHKEIKNGKA